MFTSSIGVFLFGLLVALAGGALGAAIGGNYGFVLVGFIVLASWGILAATGQTFALDYLAFGPFMGPHIVFASGVGAAIYARYRGYMEDGKDVNTPLAGLGRPDVLYVGALFGVFGFLCQMGITHIPWFGSNTDSVALTVLLSGLVARFLFGGEPGKGLGKGSMCTPHLFSEGSTLFAKIKPGPNGRWLEWQERPGALVAIGCLFGVAAGGASLVLASQVGSSLEARGLEAAAAVNNAQTFTFGISAVIILFLITNRNMPVQHHVTIIAGLAALKFFPILGGQFAAPDGFAAWFVANATPGVLVLLIAAVAGLVAAFVCEFFARLWYNRGTSHVDPPAAAIWICTTAVLSLAAALS